MLKKIRNLFVQHTVNENNHEKEQTLTGIRKHDLGINEQTKETLVDWANSSPYKEYDKDRIRQLIYQKIKSASRTKQRHTINGLIKAAAVISGIAIILFVSYSEYNKKATCINNSNSILKIVLPDYSEVFLNKNAKLTYSNSILKSFDRKVEIRGEAFFKISRTDDKKQFTVKTVDFDIHVLGTQFNVRHDKTYTSVMLTDGSIELTNFSVKQMNKIQLKVGELAVYDKLKQDLEIKESNKSIHTAWLTDKLNFHEFNMQELAEMIKLLYNKKLIIQKPELQNKRISGSAPSDDLYLVIEALKIILKVDIIEKKDSLIIK
jgi:ferric-dicitrate binding protein FerR (iron transport regulator)